MVRAAQEEEGLGGAARAKTVRKNVGKNECGP